MDRAGMELATTWSAVKLASVARHVTDCAMRPGNAYRVLIETNTVFSITLALQDPAKTVLITCRTDMASCCASGPHNCNRDHMFR